MEKRKRPFGPDGRPERQRLRDPFEWQQLEREMTERSESIHVPGSGYDRNILKEELLEIFVDETFEKLATESNNRGLIYDENDPILRDTVEVQKNCIKDYLIKVGACVGINRNSNGQCVYNIEHMIPMVAGRSNNESIVLSPAFVTYIFSYMLYRTKDCSPAYKTEYHSYRSSLIMKIAKIRRNLIKQIDVLEGLPNLDETVNNMLETLPNYIGRYYIKCLLY